MEITFEYNPIRLKVTHPTNVKQRFSREELVVIKVQFKIAQKDIQILIDDIDNHIKLIDLAPHE